MTEQVKTCRLNIQLKYDPRINESITTEYFHVIVPLVQNLTKDQVHDSWGCFTNTNYTNIDIREINPIWGVQCHLANPKY